MSIVRHFVLVNGEQQGPFTLGQLRRMWEAGQVNLQTQHFMDGYTEWMPLEYILADLESDGAPAVAVAPQITLPPKKRKSDVGPLIVVGALLILGAMILSVLSNSGGRSPRPVPTGMSPLDKRDLIEEMRAVLAPQGISIEQNSSGSVTLSLPQDLAMSAPERQIKEMALMVSKKFGGGVIVRVKSPAGQTLAEVGP